MRKTSKDSQDKIADISSQAGEILDGILTVQAFVRNLKQRFDQVTETLFYRPNAVFYQNGTQLWPWY